MKKLSLCSLIVAALVSGCGGHDHSTHDHGNVCDNSTDTVPFELGMSLTSTDSKFTITVDTVDPNPIDRGLNTWTIALTDANGSAVSDATVVLEPTMPGHGHGTSPATFSATNESNGSYSMGPFNLMMPGTWLLTFTVTDATGADSTVTVAYCIES